MGNPEGDYSRRRFISGAVALSASLTGRVEAQTDSIPRRKFGRYPDEVSVLGIGGHHLGNAATVEDRWIWPSMSGERVRLSIRKWWNVGLILARAR